jgi:hypothetical protein
VSPRAKEFGKSVIRWNILCVEADAEPLLGLVCPPTHESPNGSRGQEVR